MFDPAKYVNSFPYPSEGYREEESKIYKRFKEDLFSFLEIHGTADRIVPYDGGSSPEGESVGLPPFTPVAVSIDWMVDALGCGGEPVEQTASRTTTATWTGCAEGSRVQLVTLEGAGHSWPTGRTFDATVKIADFFFQA
jgi:polyhydroxybutyrate depolymerase